jgi:L-asparagine transporter-like permease
LYSTIYFTIFSKKAKKILKESIQMRRSSNASAPKNITWWIALVLAVAGIIFHFVSVQPFSKFSFWMVAVSAVLLLIATRFRDL